ncbi:Glyco_tranf_GTA_type domain containing protein [uncultured Caudovirales phage]|uniref:Glyco_tranf_GTA_type domain containing protein n=1 Tax=uncultured Caudovirales phage TaxID=2100421 RepID=A0A6J7XKU4_9CAUD|nr:Glyco_tranf_GTA_type domain containing protein [uncultured Caudovirales phage]CAB4185359.1 Glyco_tranf_GTA_type domain containing protein [uncultured Caudovirales phage]CAB4188453.1 Glyco_tranf_GTA_type domain containing protein [uncultured Caudovirales phage]CAB4191214.1 Glyco_tranf_GTA_type domain containing protein [uncultured Caudovirales phage]CAB5230105.1 Glyco_tranf_GTA_type domain containing protein [uncultured Caudovirales phage]
MARSKTRIPPQRPTTTKTSPGSATVCIAFIHPGTTSAYFTASLLMSVLSDRATARRIVGLKNEWSSANISASRNSLTAQFLDDTDADWLWWIDADMGWEPTALERLLTVADPIKAPIVGGLCFGALHDQLFPTIYQLAEVDGGLTTVRVHDYPRDAMVQCAATGAAFLLIHRDALTAIRAQGFNATFPWFQETEMGGKPVGEDITFCLRAKQLGIPVWVHTGVKVGHHKSTLLTEERFIAQRESEPVDG